MNHKKLHPAPLLAALSLLSIAAPGCSGSGTTNADEATADGGAGGNGDGSSGGNGSGTGSGTGSGSDSGIGAGSGTDGGTGGEGGATTKTLTIFTILMENHDYAEIVDQPGATTSKAPYINSLIAKYGLATNYMDSGVHPSLPNYLTMASGAPQYPGKNDLDPTQSPFPVAQPNLGTQLEAAKVPWRSYQESMGNACRLTASADGLYAPKHDPFLYFTDMQASALCASRNVDYSQFDADLAAGTYRYMWITPNLTDDGHNPTAAASAPAALLASDAWAKTNIDKIMASAAYKNGGVIFLTWDEAEGRNGDSKDQIPMIVISEDIKMPGFTSNKAYSHKSYLATIEDMLGLPRLTTVTNEPNMLEFLK